MSKFNNHQELYELLNQHYICDVQIALIVYVAYKLNKPLLIEGEPGVGKTEIAKQMSLLLNNKLPIRLQCYEGLTADEALYSWNYQKQLLYIQSGNKDIEDIYTTEFISPRPLYKCITSDKQEVLLIDELDKADEAFESFLLEFLAEQQITLNEQGTIKTKHNPIVYITSNNKRQLSDALKRRCLYLYLEQPNIETEKQIIKLHIPNINDILLNQITLFVNKLRNDKLEKKPSISESIDWAKTLLELNVYNLDLNIINNTLNILLKSNIDIQNTKDKTQQYYKEVLPENMGINDDWDF